jgi:transketolase
VLDQIEGQMSGSALAAQIRRTVIEESKRANVGHIGSSLSIADLLAAIFTASSSLANGEGPERDRFVLSKGHAALALYAALRATGRISEETLRSFCEDGTQLGVHPEPALQGIDFGTGSLGHGLSLAAGAALGACWQESPRRVFAILSDAECNEGSTWEAAMFAAHHRLGNLVAILDLNGQQALGYTADVLDLPGLADAWRAFGWDVRDVDGHEPERITQIIEEIAGSERPTLLIAHTTFGKGVSFMESSIEWHYWPLSEETFAQAMAELEEAGT